MIKNNLNKGHRERFKNKFLKNKTEFFYDYELLELLLFYSIPRKDVKPLAKSLIKQFGNFGNLINSHPSKINNLPGIGKSTLILLKLIKEIMLLTNKEQIIKKPILNSSEKLIRYLRSNIGYDSIENMKALYLNSKNLLLGEELYKCGTTNKICIYPREVLKAALHYDASKVILVHNHPSGFTKPSEADIAATIEIKNALKVLNIELIDHIIVSPNNEFSFKANLIV